MFKFLHALAGFKESAVDIEPAIGSGLRQNGDTRKRNHDWNAEVHSADFDKDINRASVKGGIPPSVVIHLS